MVVDSFLHGGFLGGIHLIFTKTECDDGFELKVVKSFVANKSLLASPQDFNEIVEDLRLRSVKRLTEKEKNWLLQISHNSVG